MTEVLRSRAVRPKQTPTGRFASDRKSDMLRPPTSREPGRCSIEGNRFVSVELCWAWVPS